MDLAFTLIGGGWALEDKSQLVIALGQKSGKAVGVYLRNRERDSPSDNRMLWRGRSKVDQWSKNCKFNL